MKNDTNADASESTNADTNGAGTKGNSKSKTQKLEVVCIGGVTRRCRAGHCFSGQPVVIENLTKAQIKALNDDELLVVTKI